MLLVGLLISGRDDDGSDKQVKSAVTLVLSALCTVKMPSELRGRHGCCFGGGGGGWALQLWAEIWGLWRTVGPISR